MLIFIQQHGSVLFVHITLHTKLFLTAIFFYPVLLILGFFARIQLEEAQAALASTKNELNETKEELFVTQTSLRNSDMQLRDTEKRLSQLSQNR